jgi:hypothetical protein
MFDEKQQSAQEGVSAPGEGLQPAAAPQPAPRRRITALSCVLIGCATVLVAIIVLVVVAVYALTRRHPMAPAEALMAPGWPCYVVLELRADDPRTLQFVMGGPGPALQNGQRLEPEKLAFLLPVRAAASLRPADNKEKREVFLGTSMGGSAGVWRLILALVTRSAERDPKAKVEKYKGVKLYGTGEGQWLAGMRNHLLVAPGADLVKGGVDRLRGIRPGEPVPFPGPPELADLYAGLDAKAPCRFVCTNAQGECAALLAGLKGEFEKPLADLDLPWSEVAALGGTIQPESAEKVAVRMRLQCRGEDSAALVKAALDRPETAIALGQTIEDLQTEAEGADLTVQFLWLPMAAAPAAQPLPPAGAPQQDGATRKEPLRDEQPPEEGQPF